MSYLEIEDLVVGGRYVCQLYDRSRFDNDTVTLIYLGDGFSSGFVADPLLSVYGDVRYVVRRVDPPPLPQREVST